MGDRAVLDIERIAQATAAALLQLFVDNVTVEGLERDLARLIRVIFASGASLSPL
jgi:hypothetical protein